MVVLMLVLVLVDATTPIYKKLWLFFFVPPLSVFYLYVSYLYEHYLYVSYLYVSYLYVSYIYAFHFYMRHIFICHIYMCHMYVSYVCMCHIGMCHISKCHINVCVMYQICFVKCVKEYIPTGCWLMYHVRLAGGIVASELQLMFIFSPTEYLIIIRRTGEGKNNKTQISPTFSTQNFGSIWGNNNNQHVPEGTVSGEHGALLADLAPVPASAGQGEVVESYLVDTGLPYLE